MTRVRLGPYPRVLLLGGGRVLMALADGLRSEGRDVRILMAPRLAAEQWDRQPFDAELRRRGFPLWIQEDMDPSRPPLSEVNGGTLGLSLGATWIFRPEVIRLFGGNLLNCHPSCLPEDRGGGGFSWRILRGDRRGRCALHRVDAGVDNGEVVCERGFTFPERCRIPRDFFEEQHRRELAFLLRFVRKAAAGAEFTLRPQDPARATYWPRLETSLHGAMDWGWGVQELERFVCAFDDPYAGAFTYAYHRRIYLKDCRRETRLRGSHPFLAGLIFRIYSGRLWVAACGGTLSFGQVTDSERRDVLGSLRPGDRLWTPSDLLERARTTRVFYSSTGRYERSLLSAGSADPGPQVDTVFAGGG